METESQVKEIRKALKNGQRLTCLDILYQFKCINAKGRIHDLRNEGLPIETKMMQLANGKRVAVYYLEEPKKQMI